MYRFISVSLLVAAISAAVSCLDDVTRLMERAAVEETAEVVEAVPMELKPLHDYMYVDLRHSYRAVGNTALWTVDNANHLDGWSLTGYSIFGMDSQMRRYRWKFGFISSELNMFRDIHDERLMSIKYHAPQDLEMQYRGLIGIQFMKEF